MEVSSKKFDLNAYVNGTNPTKNREKCHFIRIGVLHANSPRKIEEQMGQDGRLITTPPRLNGIGIKQHDDGDGRHDNRRHDDGKPNPRNRRVRVT
jgi:hypothetical protein